MSNLSDLWLEKYKPKKYFELLTEERTNREIQTWVKSWDEIVFGRSNKVNLLERNNQFDIKLSVKLLSYSQEKFNNFILIF